MPTTPRDERLDLVLTEREIIDLRSSLKCVFCSSATSSDAAGGPSCRERLPGLVRDWKLDLVVVNGENAAGGFGITEAIYREFIDAGADAVTLGNHAWDQRRRWSSSSARRA